MTVKLLNEHHLESLSIKGGCTGLSEYTLVKMPHCWKSHVVAPGISLRFGVAGRHCQETGQIHCFII